MPSDGDQTCRFAKALAIRRLAWVTCLMGGVLQAGLAYGQSSPLNVLKVAFLYNFISYTNWPVFPPAFNVCLLGNHGLDNELESLVSREVAGHPLQVRSIGFSDHLGGCHLVFIAASEQARAARIAALVGRQHVLTVADFPIDNASGILIGMDVEDGRLRFSVNNSKALEHGLSLSSRLLRFARHVW
ncbi:YfiR family protein [Dechloromonas sp. XY25]|uniref:YfiR family protein n=1 Tax=Dechloromonas hankyongensis TaxID=2908002 RepID=A0ABS9JYR8_9RHOO|nr:YfiR family protein [Dechloromonas hankyongensis]MCG2576057.1 YfiR family protein [Dechloromonas hankyongensis]